ncbi:TD and POZ domain-containing protein 3 [Araneus ventricosus]|uniref:TD and POZ domain-containing protein 3 n=1 Tax=Araneus ventricosus TaxID=182803 RepID=A0A4Y2X8D2_ARAVE|nr:TD and POZ domain-containing protein 3 [Araneus ventricosus]
MATRNDGGIMYTFQWKIENISHCCGLKVQDEIESPVFDTDALEDAKWSLVLRPLGADYKNYVGFFLRRQDSDGPTEIEINYKLAFLGKDGSVLKEKFSSHIFPFEYALGYQKFESRERIFFTEREEFLPEDALTVQVTLWKKDESIAKLKHLYARTVFKVNRISFVWRIENYSTVKPLLRNKHKDNLIDFDLVLNDDLGKVEIDMISFDDSIKYVSFNTSIIDSEGKKKNIRVSKYFAGDLKKGILSCMFIPKLLMGNKRLYLPNDVLSLYFESVYSTETKSNELFDCRIISPKLTKELVENSSNSAVLIDDLKSMYMDGILSDMELRTSKQTFPAHKNILSARSPVFRRMFSNDMKESSSGYVDITDLESDTVHRMLLYIYTDILEDLQIESACKLYTAADKYEIMSLKGECSSFLKDNLCPTKTCDVLILADQHQDDNLKSAVQDYILEHNEVFNLLEWQHFMETNLKLAAEVMYRKVKSGKIYPASG